MTLRARLAGRESAPSQAEEPPRRDRSTSGSRSVEFRVEIGRTPPRDRSSSASKSVHFRLEIGRTPYRVSGRSETETRGAASRSESAFRPRPDRSEDGNPKTGTREDQREPFLRPAAVNVRSTSRSFLGSVDSNGAAHGKKRPSESDSCFSLISRDWQDASAPVITFLCALRGSVHMGAGATALTRISFRVIPRFLSAQIADECAILSI